MSPLNIFSEENQRLLHAIQRWFDVRLKEGEGADSIVFSFKPDADHSSLLRRLLEGKEPLPLPPPRRNSYPWYEIYETGRGEPMEVWFPSHPRDVLLGYVMIDQGPWKLIEAREQLLQYLVQWRDGHPIFRLYRGETNISMRTQGRYGGWILERVDDPS